MYEMVLYYYNTMQFSKYKVLIYFSCLPLSNIVIQNLYNHLQKQNSIHIDLYFLNFYNYLSIYKHNLQHLSYCTHLQKLEVFQYSQINLQYLMLIDHLNLLDVKLIRYSASSIDIVPLSYLSSNSFISLFISIFS